MSMWDELKIAKTNDVAIIRRAYAKLLKQNRPEDDPAGFGRLRAAYEAAMDYAKSHAGRDREPSPIGPISTPAEVTADDKKLVIVTHWPDLVRAPSPKKVTFSFTLGQSEPLPELPEGLPPEILAFARSASARAAIVAALKRGDAASAAKLLSDAIETGTLPLADEMDLTDQLLSVTIADVTLSTKGLETLASRFNWTESDVEKAGDQADQIRRLQARIEAEAWFDRLRDLGNSPKLYLGDERVAAARILTRKGPLLAPFSRIFAPNPVLREMLEEVRFYQPRIEHRLDLKRLASAHRLTGRLRLNYRELMARSFGWIGLMCVIPFYFWNYYRSECATIFCLLLWMGIRYRRYYRPALASIFFLPVIINIIAFSLPPGPEPVTNPLTLLNSPVPVGMIGVPDAARKAWLREERRLADSREILASFYVGSYLFTHPGSLDDDRDAAVYLGRAATRYSAASVLLAELYAEGRGVTKSLPAARNILLSAANANNVVAQYKLGMMVLDGIGGNSNPELAFRYLLDAARGGNYVPAMAQVGRCYYYGRGNKADKALGLDWIWAAAEAGDIQSLAAVASTYADLREGDNAIQAYGWSGLALHMAGKIAEDLPDTLKLHEAAGERLTAEERTKTDAYAASWQPKFPKAPH
jgi:hypothetical protein